MKNLVETLENKIIAVEFFKLYNPSGLYNKDGDRVPERYQDDWVTSGMYSEEEGGELKSIDSLVEGHNHFYDDEGQLQDPSIMKIIGEMTDEVVAYFWEEDGEIKIIKFTENNIFEKFSLYGTYNEYGELLEDSDDMEADREWNFPVFDCFGQKFHACDLCEHSERFVIVDGIEHNIENLEKVKII